MKKIISIVIALLLCLSTMLVFASCKQNTPTDYVAMLKLNLNDQSTSKMEVTVKTYIDGDTTHFNVPSDMSQRFENGTLKARYLAVDTPESTGVIEVWGKQASNFTHEKLANAKSIVLESDSADWEMDSVGRTLTWVWYQPEEGSDYRLLNLELLQEGLARGKGLDDIKYVDICTKAYYQAIDQQIKLFSDEIDPLFFYNDAIQVDLKYMRTHINELAGKKVAFTGTIVKRYDQGLYVVDYNEEDEMYYGIYVYYGYTFKFTSLLQVGTEMYFVADATNSENFGFQVSNLKYDPYITDPETTKEFIQVISRDNEVPYPVTSADTFNGKKSIKVYADASDEDGTETEFDYAQLVLNTSIAFENLYVDHIYTTKTEGSSSKGAMTLYCRDAANKEVVIRTLVLYEDDKASNRMMTEADYNNKTINVKGVVDWYKPENGEGQYQIEVSSVFDITVLD